MVESETNKSEPGWPAMLARNFGYWLGGKWLLANSYLPSCSHDTPSDFFGICVASGPEPQCDDFVLTRLKDLGIQCVRLDYGYDSATSHTHRFLDRLLAEGFRVMLHLVQPREEAALMPHPEAQARWQRFLAETLDAVGTRIEMMEVGATVNRRRWAGYSLAGFLAAWRAAHEEASRRRLILAGPNVTDFEPVYNVGLLGLLRDAGRLPAVHTTNLFVERAVEPEAFDHKILGHGLRALLKFNLIKKANWLSAISRHHGVLRTFSTHTAWSLRRINRILPNTEEKQADYLARYACLAAASGALDRMYWGPLIGQREGLIDDGTGEYPDIPHVTCYGLARGTVSGYRQRPAFAAYKTAIRMLAGTRYVTSHASGAGLEIHEFLKEDRVIHVAWTMNADYAALADCYEETSLDAASYVTRDGIRLVKPPGSIQETPFYVQWPVDSRPVMKPAPHILPNLHISQQRHRVYKPVSTGRWNGMYMRLSGEPGHLFRSLLPEEIETAAEKDILRDRRNTVWAMPDPRDLSQTIVIKRRRAQNQFRNMLEFWKASRGRKAWNSTHELIRRGIPTAEPIAFFETKPPTIVYISYYLYEKFETPNSARQAFTAFANGESRFLGVEAADFYAQVADFVVNMHNRGVFFRDLSAGNLLLRPAAPGKAGGKMGNPADGKPGDRIEFCLIDTARARFYNSALSLRLRLRDLVRIAHPLAWPGRHAFLAAYFSRIGRPLTIWNKIPFVLYDVKNALKIPRRRRSAPSPTPGAARPPNGPTPPPA